MAYTFDHIEARDPNIPSLVASNAAVVIFAPGDSTKTPLALTDTTGNPLPNPVVVNALGYGPAFMCDFDRVAWEGGGYTGFFTSYEGMKEVAVASQAAAETAAADASAAAATVVTEAIVDDSGQLALTKADGSTVVAGNVKGGKGDKGDKGDKGADGANVLPTDDAIEAQIKTPGSKTQVALSATYAGKDSPTLTGSPTLNGVPLATTDDAFINTLIYGS